MSSKWDNRRVTHPSLARAKGRKGVRTLLWSGAVATDAAPFPLPAHQTGRADCPHPAFGQGSFMLSPTAGWQSELPDAGARASGRDARRETICLPVLGPDAYCTTIDGADTAYGYPPRGRLYSPDKTEVVGPSSQSCVDGSYQLSGFLTHGSPARQQADFLAESPHTFLGRSRANVGASRPGRIASPKGIPKELECFLGRTAHP
jgi:hypothetical protein